MKSTKLNYVVVGGFVIAMVVALVVTAAILTGRTGSVDTYYTAYDNVSGIKYGTQVLYEGYPIGQVEGVEPFRENGRLLFKIELSVQEGWTIPEDSIAKVAASGLLAAITIDIKAGKSPTALQPGSDIAGGALSDMFSAFRDIAGEIGELSANDLRPLLKNLNQEVGPLLQNVNSFVVMLNSLMENGAPELVTNLIEITNDLQEKTPVITDNLTDFTGDFKSMAADLRGTQQRMDQVLDSLDAFVVGLDGTIVGNKDKVDQSLTDLTRTLSAVSRHIDSIVHNLEGTTRNFHEFSRQIRQNPGVLISGSQTEDDGAAR